MGSPLPNPVRQVIGIDSLNPLLSPPQTGRILTEPLLSSLKSIILLLGTRLLDPTDLTGRSAAEKREPHHAPVEPPLAPDLEFCSSGLPGIVPYGPRLL
jgi:hypothetical protein